MTKVKNKVYLLTAGDYSDYHVEAVFSEKRGAELFAATKNDSDDYCEYRIEEYELDPAKFDGIVKTQYLYTINARGNLQGPFVFTEEGLAKKIIHDREWGLYDLDDFIILPEQDDKKAKKIAQDRIARKKANEQGISN